MEKNILLFGLLVFTGGLVMGDINDSPLGKVQPKVIQDPKTRVIYYLETDRRHVSAISPEGRLLWFCEVIPAGQGGFASVQEIRCGGDEVKVTIRDQAGPRWGVINEETGKFSKRLTPL